MPPTSPDPTPPEPLVRVRHPDPDHVQLIVRPGADPATIAGALATLPDDAFYVDHDSDPTHLVAIFRRPPQPTPPGLLVPPAGWTPSTSNGHRLVPEPAEQAVRSVTAALLLGAYDRDILRPPPERTRPTVLTVVRLVRVRANALGRSQHRRPRPTSRR